MTKQPIYAVVIYPKQITEYTESFEFRIYTKQTSNTEIMKAYYEEQKARHGKHCRVHLVTRETAKKMHDKWHQAMKQRDIELRKFYTQLGARGVI